MKKLAIITIMAIVVTGSVAYTKHNSKPTEQPKASQSLQDTEKPKEAIVEAPKAPEPAAVAQPKPRKTEPPVPAQPVETRDSYLASITWPNDVTKQCFTDVISLKPIYFDTLAKAKAAVTAINGTFITPCALVQYRSYDDSVTYVPYINAQYWGMIEYKLAQ